MKAFKSRNAIIGITILLFMVVAAVIWWSHFKPDNRLLENRQMAKVEESVIEALKSVKVLEIGQADNQTIKLIGKLTNLRKLSLLGTQVSDISALKNLRNLEVLYLTKTKVKDISTLKDLKELRELYLQETQVEDISVLKDLKKLYWLELGETKVPGEQISELLRNSSFLTILFIPYEKQTIE